MRNPRRQRPGAPLATSLRRAAGSLRQAAAEIGDRAGPRSSTGPGRPTTNRAPLVRGPSSSRGSSRANVTGKHSSANEAAPAQLRASLRNYATLLNSGLSVSAVRALRSAGVITMTDLAACSRDDLETILGIRRSSVEEVSPRRVRDRTTPAEEPSSTPGVDDHSSSACTGSARADVLRGVDVALEDAGLSARALNVLRSLGLRTLGGVAECPRCQLEAIPQVGRKTVDHIEETLARHGVALAEPPTPCDRAAGPRADGRERDSRAADMVERRLAGATLAEIAGSYDLSRQRVAQIMKAAGLAVKADREITADRERAEAEARRDDVLQAFRRGDTAAQTARLLQLKESAVRELLLTRLTPTDRVVRRGNRPRPNEPRYSDEDLIAAVRDVGQRYGRAPTSGEYVQAAAGGMLPSMPTITNRIGWRRAVELAGFDARRQVRSYSRRWTEQTCRQALRCLVVETGEVPTSQQYQSLSQLDDSLPSYATVRQRLGPWAKVAAEMARLPSRAEALSRVWNSHDGSGHVDAAAIWMAYLEEDLSVEDVVVLCITGDFVWADEFGEPPRELAEAV